MAKGVEVEIFSLFGKYFDFRKCFRVYDQVQVKAEPLTLIVPQFEVPLPPLLPAVRLKFNYRKLQNRIFGGRNKRRN